MQTPTCTRCRRAIPAEDINVANDVAYCRACNLSYQLSDLTSGLEADFDFDPNRPTQGAWYQTDGMTTKIGATQRSLGTAAGALFICLFWNGIVSVFVLVALAGTLSHLGITLPDWFPAPEMNKSPMGVGMTLFLWIFLTPFIVIGAGMILAFLSALAGWVEVRLGADSGALFRGIGPVGITRHFQPALVKKVRLEETEWTPRRGPTRSKTHIIIEMEQGKPLKFGSDLTTERRSFVMAALRVALQK